MSGFKCFGLVLDWFWFVSGWFGVFWFALCWFSGGGIVLVLVVSG